jgi:hypothetical protein
LCSVISGPIEVETRAKKYFIPPSAAAINKTKLKRFGAENFFCDEKKIEEAAS